METESRHAEHRLDVGDQFLIVVLAADRRRLNTDGLQSVLILQSTKEANTLTQASITLVSAKSYTKPQTRRFGSLKVCTENNSWKTERLNVIDWFENEGTYVIQTASV